MDDQDLLARAADRLQDRAEDLTARQMAALKDFPSYDRVPDEDLQRSCRRNVARVVATLRGQDLLPLGIEEDERASGQRRALQGVPPEDVVAAYRAVLGVLRDAFIDEASAQAIDMGAVLGATRRLWELTDRFSTILVSARHQVDLDTARRDERQRMAFLHHVLTGNVPTVELAQGGALHGMMPEGTYWVFRAHLRAGDLQRLSRDLERGFGPHGTGVLLGPIDGDLAGISLERPTACDDAVIAVAGPAPLLRVQHAFAEATRLLTVAMRFGNRGVIDMTSMSVRVAVAQDDGLGEVLYRRYVENLNAHSSMPGVLLETVTAFLCAGRSMAASAHALSIHVNTLRYRLERYEAITGIHLTDTTALIEVWWALEYAKIRRDRGASDGRPTAARAAPSSAGVPPSV